MALAVVATGRAVVVTWLGRGAALGHAGVRLVVELHAVRAAALVALGVKARPVGALALERPTSEDQVGVIRAIAALHVPSLVGMALRRLILRASRLLTGRGIPATGHNPTRTGAHQAQRE